MLRFRGIGALSKDGALEDIFCSGGGEVEGMYSSFSGSFHFTQPIHVPTTARVRGTVMAK